MYTDIDVNVIVDTTPGFGFESGVCVGVVYVGKFADCVFDEGGGVGTETQTRRGQRTPKQIKGKAQAPKVDIEVALVERVWVRAAPLEEGWRVVEPPAQGVQVVEPS